MTSDVDMTRIRDRILEEAKKLGIPEDKAIHPMTVWSATIHKFYEDSNESLDKIMKDEPMLGALLFAARGIPNAVTRIMIQISMGRDGTSTGQFVKDIEETRTSIKAFESLLDQAEKFIEGPVDSKWGRAKS